VNIENRIGCQCSALGDRVRINLGAETTDLLRASFDTLRDRNAWLHLARCQDCGQHWYAAVDTVDDDYYFRRLSAAEVTAVVERNEWPADYDGFVNVWPLDGSQNFRARLRWPWQDQEFESR
jgi:hypothetical protein